MADSLVDHIVTVAGRWADPEYGVRVQAVEETLVADNPFTEAAVAVAVNRQMSRLTRDALQAWQTDLLRATARSNFENARTVGVLNPGNIPLVELQDLLAVVLAGWRYTGTVSSRSPALFPAFLDDLHREHAGLAATILDLEDVLSVADALIASGSDDTMDEVDARAERADIPEQHRWLRGHRIGVAVLDGRESEEEREQLAEDALLYEGAGCRSVAIVWAPSGTSPDPYLDAFAEFRAAFPAPESVSGRLRMQQALLAAVDTPHAWAEDFQFLISRGAPEAQGPAHLRWCEYDDVDVVAAWTDKNKRLIQEVYTPERLARTFPHASRFGDAQHPPLAWCPDGLCHTEFFARTA